jgi:NAD(P)-dependent dehydrogenase (short-subunit alcohol dehydrogenase family)
MARDLGPRGITVNVVQPGTVDSGRLCSRRPGLRLPDRSVQFLDADQIARGIAEGAVANPVRLLGRLLDDLGSACTFSKVPLRSAVASRIQP